MSVTARDKKILLVLLALAAVAGYWFLLLGPKREAASQAAVELAAQEERRDAAAAQLAQLEATRSNYASDYTTLVRLGQATPSDVDTPSLIVQLERAARGTGISFDRIATGQRSEVATPPPPPPPPDEEAQSAPPAGPEASGAGGEPAASGPGRARDEAADAASASGGSTSAGPPSSTQPSTAAGSEPGAAPDALETVPLEFTFAGSFLDLADFFHATKRFVVATNDGVQVRGRLITIDGLHFTSDPEALPKLTAEVTATVYLSPRSEGPTAGATPRGPAAVASASPPSAPDGASSDEPATAAVTR